MSEGLCGRYFKGGVEADKWYFGTKCLTQKPYEDFGLTNWCMKHLN